jgi:hypothetical protein
MQGSVDEAHPYLWAYTMRDVTANAGLAPLTTSEQLFFHGAPLAHVLEYEDHLRTARSTTCSHRSSVVPGPNRPHGRLRGDRPVVFSHANVPAQLTSQCASTDRGTLEQT